MLRSHSPIFLFFNFLGLFFVVNLLFIGCCPKDPTCEGATSLCPGNFWQPPDNLLVCPCDYPWDQEIEEVMKSIQQSNVQVADLIDVALIMNPTTQFTWANARAAAYNVEVARSALYPTVTLNDNFTYSDTEYDDGPPLMVANANMGNTLNGTTTAAANDSSLLSGQNRTWDPLGLELGTQKLLRGQSHLTDSAGTHLANRAFRLTHTNLGRRAINRGTVNAAAAGAAVGAAAANATAANSSLVVGNFAQSIGTSRILTHDLSISYLLLDFGGREANIEAAKQALYNSNWMHNRQIQQVLISVLQAYYNYEGISYLLEARNSDLKNAQKNYESASIQFELGTRNKLDVLQAETDLINVELSIVQLTGQKQVAYGTLANALGFQANISFKVPEISKYFAAIDRIEEKVDELIEEAKRRRPDLAAAYALHAQRKAQVIIARSQGLPTLGALVDLQEFNDLINPQFNTHSISGSLMLSVPIFSGFLYVNQERAARELVRAACANIRAVEINVSLDVLTSYFNFKTAVKSVHYSEEYLKYSKETYEAALLMYQEGVGTILDLLNAQRALANAKAQLIQSQTNWAIALSNVSFAMGTTGTEEEFKPWKPGRQHKDKKRQKGQEQSTERGNKVCKS